ncbi:methyltransferase family protein [Humibacillus xanthopallidus]|uniref:Methyltransferase family protein n=1 Tax=Humibacillus xanthopallidus TaxID=412689 RepID=A0A543PMH2_9MICO|nr:class I SAM-dependent methyltransferase [Humibacillus xanthopallidus]TQN45256.1 methyltransferase family protein [Humibacillus xanthopallidus]
MLLRPEKADTVIGSTETPEYAERLRAQRHVWWKRILPVQLPYRINVRRQRLGRTLDLGCGIGRNLSALSPGSLGVDHNPHSVELARRAGLRAMTDGEFLASDEARPASFDGLLVAHVLEHMDADLGRKLLQTYLPYLRPGGAVFIICPQEAGYHTDPTHVQFTTSEDIERICRSVGLTPRRSYSFPFPRRLGRVFAYNEFCVRATLDVAPG